MSTAPPAPTPGRLERALLRLGTAGELLAMMVRSGRWWMLPLIGLLILLSGLFIALQGVQHVAPFIYMVF